MIVVVDVEDAVERRGIPAAHAHGRADGARLKVGAGEEGKPSSHLHRAWLRGEVKVGAEQTVPAERYGTTSRLAGCLVHSDESLADGSPSDYPLQLVQLVQLLQGGAGGGLVALGVE